LRPEARAWLAALPSRVEFAPGWWAVHGSLRDRDEYLFGTVAVQANFARMEELQAPRVVFFGHTHRRAAFVSLGRQIALIPDDALTVRPELRYLINPGGAGQPRDGAPAAPYVVVEDETIYFRRAPYDVETAAALTAVLPFGELLAERLRRGG
jgi:predicted phosphodiesterase